MRRAVVCVATTERYQRGMARLSSALCGDTSLPLMFREIPATWPVHEDKPYAFKAYALRQAMLAGADLVLWADACILPVRSLEPLWERIERDGYWICRNGWTNYEWTADSAYPDLFEPERKAAVEMVNQLAKSMGDERGYIPTAEATAGELPRLREYNKRIPHVVATSFGLNLRSDIGKAFLAEYFRLASETRAFCGPWRNLNNQACPTSHATVCGPADVLGHRHDQTAASVIAWRLGMKLCDPPEVFAYGKAGEPTDERTILIADGSYE